VEIRRGLRLSHPRQVADKGLTPACLKTLRTQRPGEEGTRCSLLCVFAPLFFGPRGFACGFLGFQTLWPTLRTDPLRKGWSAAMNWRSTARLRSAMHAPGEGTRPAILWLGAQRTGAQFIGRCKDSKNGGEVGLSAKTDTLAASRLRGLSALCSGALDSGEGE